jgi:K+-transporting ATPase ATPase B chain
MSGVDFNGTRLRKGAGDSIAKWVRENGGSVPREIDSSSSASRVRGTPPVVAESANGGARVLGAIYLKDIVKGGMRERFDRLRAMGIRTIMITGDNPLTAAAIAKEAGVDDFLAEAKPEDKMQLIRREQSGGRLVAMTGDGTNDAPALAQADVGVAMNTGTQAAREAGNMVDLDSNPTKLIEIVEIGKQLLMTRGSLTTFSIANNVAKYFAIIPALVLATYPAGRSQPDAVALTAVGHSEQRHLQRADHHRLHSTGAARSEVPPRLRWDHSPSQSRDLRHRRPDRSVHRHQADRRHSRFHSRDLARAAS